MTAVIRSLALTPHQIGETVNYAIMAFAGVLSILMGFDVIPTRHPTWRPFLKISGPALIIIALILWAVAMSQTEH